MIKAKNIILLTKQCRKILEGFLVGKRAEKCHFLGEFSRISGSKRLPAVCTTEVQLGILRLIKYDLICDANHTAKWNQINICSDE